MPRLRGLGVKGNSCHISIWKALYELLFKRNGITISTALPLLTFTAIFILERILEEERKDELEKVREEAHLAGKMAVSWVIIRLSNAKRYEG